MGVCGQHHAVAVLSPGKTRYRLHRRLGGPHGRSERVRKILPPLGFDPQTVQPVAGRYTDWAIPAPEKHRRPGFIFYSIIFRKQWGRRWEYEYVRRKLWSRCVPRGGLVICSKLHQSVLRGLRITWQYRLDSLRIDSCRIKKKPAEVEKIKRS
jgi:hypothetical protein